MKTMHLQNDANPHETNLLRVWTAIVLPLIRFFDEHEKDMFVAKPYEWDEELTGIPLYEEITPNSTPDPDRILAGDLDESILFYAEKNRCMGVDIVSSTRHQALIALGLASKINEKYVKTLKNGKNVSAEVVDGYYTALTNVFVWGSQNLRYDMWLLLFGRLQKYNVEIVPHLIKNNEIRCAEMKKLDKIANPFSKSSKALTWKYVLNLAYGINDDDFDVKTIGERVRFLGE